jgi:dTDP-6-deoxy-L-talose 4-dehydrogenase (NAD+)
MKRILVTGATGFIGRYVVNHLLQRKCNVVVAVRDTEQVKTVFGNVDIELVPFNMETVDPDKNYYEYFQSPDTLVHLAWEGLPNYKSSFHVEENLPRHIKFLGNLIRNGLKDMVVTGTCLEYGMLEGELFEDMKVEPVVPYAMAKHQLHDALIRMEQQFNVQVKWLRLFYMWGEGQAAGSLIPQLNQAIQDQCESFPMSGGQQIRDFLPVEKMAEYIADFAMAENIGGCFNCCSGEPVTVKQFVETYLKSKGSNIKLALGVYPYPDYEPMTFWGSTKKLKTIIHSNESDRTV